MRRTALAFVSPPNSRPKRQGASGRAPAPAPETTDSRGESSYLDIRAGLRYQLSVPVIARFYGITVKMYFREHGVPHFHAVYGEFNGVYEVSTLEMIEGDLPIRAQRLVKDWAERYRDELVRMWQTQEYKLLPGLD
jgi:hypothetical protein